LRVNQLKTLVFRTELHKLCKNVRLISFGQHLSDAVGVIVFRDVVHAANLSIVKVNLRVHLLGSLLEGRKQVFIVDLLGHLRREALISHHIVHLAFSQVVVDVCNPRKD
jgi:hypothetical protein